MSKRYSTSRRNRRNRYGFFAMDALCAAALLIALLGIVATAVVKIGRDRRTALQQTVAEQVVMNAAERIVRSGENELESVSKDIPDWALSQLPGATLSFSLVEANGQTDFEQPVDMDGVRIRLSWDDRPGIPPRRFETVTWR